MTVLEAYNELIGQSLNCNWVNPKLFFREKSEIVFMVEVDSFTSIYETYHTAISSIQLQSDKKKYRIFFRIENDND